MLHPSSKLVVVMLVSDITRSLSLRIVNIELNSVPGRQMKCFFPTGTSNSIGGSGGEERF